VKRPRVVVVGAGMGGLAAAADLARQGCAVTVLEAGGAPGGKARVVEAGGLRMDAGPTVFTMRWIFEELFADAGESLAEHLGLLPVSLLARHAWVGGGALDLHADVERSVEAIAAFAGPADAAGYRAFCARAADIHATLAGPFIASQRPSPLDLVRRVGLRRLDAMMRTAPMSTMWRALGRHFNDPRLRQLFGRYATYCGSSPFRAPATLMLVAHVEQAGVWRVRGGMAAVARALADLAIRHGAALRCDAPVAAVTVDRGAVTGVLLESGERVAADAVVFNGDVSALGQGLLGAEVTAAARPVRPAERSQSAVTWCVAARPRGFDLAHHTVFFSNDYAAEFEATFDRRVVPDAPTVYVCAQDRDDACAGPGGPERCLVLVNAPPDGDVRAFDLEEVEAARARAWGVMQACGLSLQVDAAMSTAPDGFARLFPGSGGALYGRANHGPFASFQRPGARTKVRGLHVAGGSAHPGPGVPMAAMSGRLAAAAIMEDAERA
jgi:1-hydroxycarotenoid 3,4-desaturase